MSLVTDNSKEVGRRMRCILDKCHLTMLLLLLVVTLTIQTYLATIRSGKQGDKNSRSALGEENNSHNVDLSRNISPTNKTANNTRNEFVQILNRKAIYQRRRIERYGRPHGNLSNTIALYDFDSSVLGIDIQLSRCKVNSCELISNYNMKNTDDIEPSAVIFYSEKLPSSPPRNDKQIFIYLELEPSKTLPQTPRVVNNWNNQFNWTMTYRQYSDISLPTHVVRHIYMGSFKNPNVKYMYTISRGKPKIRKPIQRNYHQIVKSKRYTVAWIQQKCCNVCKHDKFVNDLKRHVQLHKFELCNYTEIQQISIARKVIRDYKFVLVLEDMPCVDFIPRIVFSLYTENVIPILQGDKKYSTQLPAGTYMDINKYSSPQLLANQLLRLNDDDRSYSRMLKLKDVYEVVPSSLINQMALCEVCERLNNLNRNKKLRKTINNLDALLTERQGCV